MVTIYIYIYMLVSCPHCFQMLFIESLNCGIFRCGVYKHSFVPIPPHLDKLSCDMLVSKNLIYGCSKPFKVNNNYQCVKCDYI